MKLTLSVAILLLLISCSKHNNTGSTGTTVTGVAPPVTMKLNLTTSIPNEEIIFSDSGGKILLDTMTPYPSPLVASLVTNQTLIDLTTIYYDTPESRYEVATYKAVNPAIWSSLELGTYSGSAFPNLSGTNGTVVYKNTPPIPTGQFLIDDYVNNFSYTGGQPVSGYLNANYPICNPGNYVFLGFPYTNQYNFHIPPVGRPDTVDLTNMDVAGIINYTKPAGYYLTENIVYAIMDSTDPSRSLLVYNNFGDPTLPDVEYPRKLAQKLEMFAGISTGYNHSDELYSYGDSIPAAVYWPSDGDYKMTSSQFNSFSVSFMPTVRPTDYNVSWKTNSLLYTIDAPSDSSTLNPQNMLFSLKGAKLLQGQSLSGLTLASFGFETLGGMDYAGYYSFLHDPAQLKSKHLSSRMSYSISF